MLGGGAAANVMVWEGIGEMRNKQCITIEEVTWK